jgi:phosphoglycerate dehydrogenase-like enzyme
MSLIFALALKLFENESYVRNGGWARRDPLPSLGMDIQGKTLGVIGFGRIGQEVTRRMQALGMRTLWYDIFDQPHPSAPKSEYRPLDALLAESDFVSLHTNLDASSRHLIGTAQLALMKPTAFLINTARGPLVDQPALTHALKTGQIAGAALDVLEREPPDPDDPIVQLPNVICFPHIGTATVETRRAMRELAVRNLLAVLAGERPPAPVNPEVLG